MKKYTKYNYNWHKYEFKEPLRDYEDDYSSDYFIQVIGNLEDELEKLQERTRKQTSNYIDIIKDLKKQIMELKYDINK